MFELTSSRRIISPCKRFWNSSHSSLYFSISSFVCLIFFLRTSRRVPCWILVVILTWFFFSSFISQLMKTVKPKIDWHTHTLWTVQLGENTRNAQLFSYYLFIINFFSMARDGNSKEKINSFFDYFRSISLFLSLKQWYTHFVHTQIT